MAESGTQPGKGGAGFWGRSVFKRSGFVGPRCNDWCDAVSFSSQKQKRWLRQDAWADVLEIIDGASCPWELELSEELNAFEAHWEFLDGSWHLPPGTGVELDKAWDCYMDDETCSTCSSTAATSDEICTGMLSTKTVADMPSRPKAHLWEAAMGRVRKAAELCRASRPAESGHSDGRRGGSRLPRLPASAYKGEHKLLVNRLAGFRVSVPFAASAKLDSPFEKFRWQFLRQHGEDFCASLSTLGSFRLAAAPLSLPVGEAFLEACRGEPQDNLVAAYHGTRDANLSSIYANGLVIPGKGNSVKVANGSAHGLGIYTAVASNPSLSLGYARDTQKRLLVCGVLDSADPAVVYKTGSAMVIFDPNRVAPLWEATLLTPPTRPAVVTRVPRVLRVPAPPPGRLPKRPRKPAVRLVGIASFLARRAVRRRRGAFDFRNSLALQGGCSAGR